MKKTNKKQELIDTHGQSYNYSDQELIRMLVRSRMTQKQEMEFEDLDGYVLPPRTQFSMVNKPSVSLRYGKIVFNMACIRLFDEVEFILPLIHEEKKRLTIVMCPEEESGSVAWARRRRKDQVWINKNISSEDYVLNIFHLMGWKNDCRYKILGRVANSREGLVLVFDLEEAIMYSSKPEEIKNEETGEVIKRKYVKYYPDLYHGKMGRSYSDYVEAKQMNMFEYLEGYANQTYADHVDEVPVDQV